ncbi:hypothetical protein M9458_040761, partial [Cirrhinus mrigala]
MPAKEESKLPAPCVLWPVELSPEDTLVHFQGQYMTICELDYNILQVEIQNAVKSNVSVQKMLVQNIKEDLFHVFLLDHGDVLIVGPGHLSSISDPLLMLPPKIVCGFFANILPVQNQWDSLTESYFSSLIGSQIKGYIHARLSYHVLILEVPDINCDLLKLRLGRHVDTSTFLLLVEMLIEEPIPQSNESVPDLLIEKQIGQECCLKSSSLLGFEEILSLNGPKLKSKEKMKSGTEDLCNASLSTLSGYCESVKEQDETIKNQQLELLKTGLLGKALEVEIDDFCKDQNIYLVTLSTAEKHSEEQAEVKLLESEVFDSKSNFPQSVLAKMYATEVKEVQTSDTVRSEAVPDGSFFEGYVVHVQMPGALCCAMYEKDMHYYRALIVDTLEKGAEVFFIDFGNTEKVPSMLIKKLPRKFASQPEFALKCALAHVAPVEDIWTTTASNFFRQVTSDKTLTVHVVHRKNGKYVVDLFERGAENNTSIATIMTTAKMALDWRYNPALASVKVETPCNDKGNALGKKKNRKSDHMVTFHNVASSRPNHVFFEQLNDAGMPKPKVIHPDTFEPMHFKPGSELRVICSHVNSPSDFWCQNENTKVDLDKLMKEMQAFYQTRTTAFKPHSICCAVKAPQDNRWHRARILEEKNNKLSVMLVDFGISIQEERQNIQALAPQFFELHEQAFRCALNLIEPVGGRSWSAEACSFFRDFCEGSSTVCRINSQLYEEEIGLLNVVTIHTPLQQATTYLVEKGVAKEMQTPKQLLPSAHPRSFVYSSFNITPGSEELVHVTQVCSPWEIYVQLDRNTEIVESLMKRVEEESQLLIMTSEDCSENVCLAKYICDNKWYRALTHPVQSHQHVGVFFVDYGDMQISEKTNVVPIPTTAVDLLMTPMQALRCSLLNVPEGEHLPEVNAWLETDILNKSFRAKFVSRDNSGHFVCDLYDGSVLVNEKVKELMSTQGAEEHDPAVSKPALDSHQEVEDVGVSKSKANSKASGRGKTKHVDKQTPKLTKSSKPECKGPIKAERQNTPCSFKVMPTHQSLPKLGDLPAVNFKPGFKGVGFISHCNSVRSFFVQMEDDEPNILQMGEELNSTVFKDNMKNLETEVRVGDLVVAEFEEDLALYRAVVTNASNCGHLAVEFIDYGNTATVDRKNVHMLTSMFLSQPRLSTQCTLAKPYSCENEDSFIKEAAGRPLMVEFIRKLENSWEVRIEVIEDGQVHGESKYDGYQSKEVDLTSQKASQSNQTGAKAVKTVQQKTIPYRQQCKCELKNTQKEVRTFQQKTKSNTQQRKSEFGSGQTVATKQVKKSVTFLPTCIKTKEFLRRRTRKRKVNSQPQCATSVSVTKNSSMLQEKVSPYAKDLETSKSPVAVSLRDVEDDKSVKSPDKSLVVDDHPRFPKSCSSCLDRPQTLFQAPVQMNFEYNGFAAAVTTPSEFYVILEDLLLIVDTVSAILENLPEASVPLPKDHFFPGASCLVKSAEKKKWCRAEIVQCDFTSVLMNLVDYGQYVVMSQWDVDQLKKLPEELSRLPKVTYHCLLRGVKPKGQDWSDEAIVFFQNSMCHSNLQIRFRQHVSETQWEQGANRESKQDITSRVNVFPTMTEHTSKAECSQPLFSK